MVKDYKRLHHLDFAQPDLDDSDGGYSDYQISDAEDSNALDSAEDQEVNKDKTANLIPTSPFYCVTCKREYRRGKIKIYCLEFSKVDTPFRTVFRSP